jgi:hypothetical protein
MQEFTPVEIDLEEFEARVAASLSEHTKAHGARNDNVFSPFPGPVRKIPHLIYYLHYSWIWNSTDQTPEFIQKAYVWLDGDPRRPHTWQQIPVDRAKEMAETLTNNARLPQAQQNPAELRVGHFYDHLWERVCYVILVMDSPGWDFAHSASTNGAALYFYEDQGSELNHSFYDGELLTIHPVDPSTGRATPRTAILMVNHMVDKDWNPLGKVQEAFRFKMAARMPTRPHGGKGVEIDPGGINEGPPQSPP